MTSNDEIATLRRDLAAARAEARELQAALDGDLPRALAWLNAKVARQRVALDTLQRKGRGHTHTERAEALEAA